MQQLLLIDDNNHNIGEDFKDFLNKQTEVINNLISSIFTLFRYYSAKLIIV